MVVHAAEAHGEGDLSAAFLSVVQTAVLSPNHQGYQASPCPPHQESLWVDPAHPSFQVVLLAVVLLAGGLWEVIPGERQGKLHPEASSVPLYPMMALLGGDLAEEILVVVLEEAALVATMPKTRQDSFLERLEIPLAVDHAVEALSEGVLSVGVLEEGYLMANRTRGNPFVVLQAVTPEEKLLVSRVVS